LDRVSHISFVDLLLLSFPSVFASLPLPPSLFLTSKLDSWENDFFANASQGTGFAKKTFMSLMASDGGEELDCRADQL